MEEAGKEVAAVVTERPPRMAGAGKDMITLRVERRATGAVSTTKAGRKDRESKTAKKSDSVVVVVQTMVPALARRAAGGGGGSDVQGAVKD